MLLRVEIARSYYRIVRTGHRLLNADMGGIRGVTAACAVDCRFEVQAKSITWLHNERSRWLQQSSDVHAPISGQANVSLSKLSAKAKKRRTVPFPRVSVDVVGRDALDWV